MVAVDHAERARALIGTRFRPQGRGADGVDCIGLVLKTFAIDPAAVSRDYALSGNRVSEIHSQLLRFFRRVPTKQARSGDVLLLACARDQLHLAILTAPGFVHAHAGLRRVVETPGQPGWPVLGCYRFRRRRKKA